MPSWPSFLPPQRTADPGAPVECQAGQEAGFCPQGSHSPLLSLGRVWPWMGTSRRRSFVTGEHTCPCRPSRVGVVPRQVGVGAGPGLSALSPCSRCWPGPGPDVHTQHLEVKGWQRLPTARAPPRDLGRHPPGAGQGPSLLSQPGHLAFVFLCLLISARPRVGCPWCLGAHWSSGLARPCR